MVIKSWGADNQYESLRGTAHISIRVSGYFTTEKVEKLRQHIMTTKGLTKLSDAKLNKIIASHMKFHLKKLIEE